MVCGHHPAGAPEPQAWRQTPCLQGTSLPFCFYFKLSNSPPQRGQATEYRFEQTPPKPVLLLHLLPVKGCRLPLINLSCLEVKESHRVHFYIIEADSGVGATVSLGDRKPGHGACPVDVSHAREKHVPASTACKPPPLRAHRSHDSSAASLSPTGTAPALLLCNFRELKTDSRRS